MKTRCLATLALLFATACASSNVDPAAEQVSPEPQGPLRVLLLGDSISMGYTNPVREILGESAVVDRARRPDGEKNQNCAGTTFGKDHIERWLAQGDGTWDVIHFNWGLHDLKHVDPVTGKNSQKADDPQQANPELYGAQLAEITDRLAESGAILIFATTTPVPEGVRPYREPSDVEVYNEVALEVMRERGIAIDDLYTFAMEQLDEIQNPKDVHFSKEGSRALAGAVAESILFESGRSR